MGLSASQGRLLLLTARRSDLEYRAQQISQKRLILSQQLEEISLEYESATSNRQMKINLFGTEKDDNGNNIRRSMNLTYAALVSGVYQHGEELTGIQKSSYVQSGGWTSNNAYRLVSTEGAIVVSSFDEIPKTISKSTETLSNPTSYTSEGGKSYSNVYNITETTQQDGKDASVKTKELAIHVPQKDADGKNTELYNALNGETKRTADVGFSPETGVVFIGDDAYDVTTGKKLESLPDGNNDKTTDPVALYSAKKDIPNSKTITNSATKVSEGYGLEKGNDNCWTLYDEKGNVVNRYVVDENLRLGMTDSAGSYDGPNYLQDCLRNGKYLLEQGKADENTDEGFRWSSVSWDTTSNISDSYYTEDDDAAKAKYDRLQSQIQAQDKKLELELDNIETQRSAVTTEVESVEKVINEDIEGTFNAFG